MTGPHGWEPGERDPGGTAAGPPRVPQQRTELPPRAAERLEEDGVAPDEGDVPGHPGPAGEPVEEDQHQELMSLLGAWALAACSAEESERLESHLNDCARCAEEAVRLRDAATLLEPQRSLDVDPGLRPRVLDACLARRPARLPVPSWAAPYDAETARLDALLNDITADEWRTPLALRWYAGGAWERRATTVAGVLDHLLAVDGLLARSVGLPDPLGESAVPGGPLARTLACWTNGPPAPDGAVAAAAGSGRRPGAKECPARAWRPWREQSRALVRAAATTGGRTGEYTVSRADYGDPGLFVCEEPDVELALSDAYLDRAFACWVHAGDIADAVSYPYEPPFGPHLRLLVDLTARRLPGSIAGRRRAGLASLARRLTPAGKPGRTLHLEVEGAGGGDWYIPLDSPDAAISRAAARDAVAHVALDDVVFCQLAAGRVTPEEAAAGSGVAGDRDAVHDVLFAAADLSRL
ncbi:MDMPI N domain containing protein [Streptomyces sp. B6B3]|uniref:MDMPI N domain containing protein n=1 Tax=Streptomyces sp. B6B3 TaxID=3153570 RepID=UPI00325F1957